MKNILNFKQKPLCIYHAHCLDGFTAAWVVKKHFGFGADKIDFHAAQYGEEPPFVLGRDVIMVDFSFKRDMLIDMAKVANAIVMLDHHQDANAYQGFVDQGGAINRAHIKNVMNAIENGRMRTELAGFDIPMLNASPNMASDAGNIMAKDEPFAMVYWQGPNGTTCSLRSAEGGEDVAKIAEQFGGGGHEHAAGFTVKKG